ncbi:MAG: 50S ribosomal protein L24 [Anaerolineae bacterium]|nr:50S ribosomal protein L24 [Anaerolineae bacterium]MDW8173831.1 50S ribosomal protein L24 [Anaerolineae bacterium]
MQRIKKGDTVEIIAGKDKGERGQIVQVMPKENRVVVDGLNMVKRHQKARQRGGQNIPAQIIDKPAPLDGSNVMLVCPKCDQRTRVGFRIKEDGMKTRVCKKCKADVD